MDYTTQLTPDEEQNFQNWVKTNNIPWQDVPKADYDMRGYWKAQQSGDPNAKRSTENQHFPDTWKTPYHKTFSNESMYAPPDAPHWEGDRLIDKDGKVVADESKKMAWTENDINNLASNMTGLTLSGQHAVVNHMLQNPDALQSYHASGFKLDPNLQALAAGPKVATPTVPTDQPAASQLQSDLQTADTSAPAATDNSGSIGTPETPAPTMQPTGNVGPDKYNDSIQMTEYGPIDAGTKTADTNSANGIGAWNNDLTPNVSVALNSQSRNMLGITKPGQEFMYNGTVYRYDDNIPEIYDNPRIDVFKGKYNRNG